MKFRCVEQQWSAAQEDEKREKRIREEEMSKRREREGESAGQICGSDQCAVTDFLLKFIAVLSNSLMKV